MGNIIKFKNKADVILPGIEVIFRTPNDGDSITLPTNGNNNYTIDWGDGSPEETNTVSGNTPSHSYTTAGDYTVKVFGSLDKWCFGEVQTSRDKITSINKFDCPTIGLTNLENAFHTCSILTNVSGVVMTGVETIFAMLYDCDGLVSLDLSNWDTSSCTDMNRLLYSCDNLVTTGDLSGWDVSSVTDMTMMFNQDNKITDNAVSTWWDGSNPQITAHAYCFNNNTLRPNYGDIPNDWKSS